MEGGELFKRGSIFPQKRKATEYIAIKSSGPHNMNELDLKFPPHYYNHLSKQPCNSGYSVRRRRDLATSAFLKPQVSQPPPTTTTTMEPGRSYNSYSSTRLPQTIIAGCTFQGCSLGSDWDQVISDVIVTLDSLQGSSNHHDHAL